MAGVEGFEPPNASTKNWCLTTWPHPTAVLLGHKTVVIIPYLPWPNTISVRCPYENSYVRCAYVFQLIRLVQKMR